ncbi:maleate cis-trans isomerase [Azospirillum soli]|nr:maleate cis-trans isomerase [Azospirillum soli]
MPNTLSAVESITTVTGPPVLASADATSRSALRREKVV